MKFEFSKVIPERVDKFLSSKLKGVSRSFIQKLIQSRRVLVGKNIINSSGYILRLNDVVQVNFPKEKNKLKPEKKKFEIVFEDNDILVVDKPKGIAVHPASSKNTGALINSFIHKIELEPSGERPGIVHRLDKDTTGLLVIAKNKESLKGLKDQFQKRKVEKTYLTLVHGHIVPTQGQINIPLDRDRKLRTKRTVSIDGKKSITEYKVLEYINHQGEDFTLIEATLITGRTHQIRVHFQAIGYPIVGDKDYSNKKFIQSDRRLGAKRQFLHAYRLGFYHPRTGRWMGFKSELPRDLTDILIRLRASD